VPEPHIGAVSVGRGLNLTALGLKIAFISARHHFRIIFKEIIGMNLLPIILSGGAGTRLWPASRESSPKPFIPLPDNHTLLEKTYQRAMALPGVEEVFTVTNRDYYFRCRDEFLAASHESPLAAQAYYLLEPFGRNTAPAIALAGLEAAARHGEDAIMLILPSDHLIAETGAFAAAVSKAAQLALSGFLVTFGITPTAPETGFGYIQQGEAISDLGYKVARFVEKPDLATAKDYLASGEYTWNSGMFCFTAGTLLRALTGHAPDVLEAARGVLQASKAKCSAAGDHLEFSVDAFRQLPDISIDYALMEKSAEIAVVRGSFDWNDIGSWNALASLMPADNQGNRILGEVVALSTQNCYLHSESRVIGAIGLQDMVVVDTPDALLVARCDQLQQVKDIVAHLKKIGHESFRTHRMALRPWGSYTVLEEGPRFKIKRIEVKPGASLSLQMHHHRSEHWVVVGGTAKITNSDREMLLRPDESTYIPAGQKHRLENPGVIPLVMIEVQTGDYVGEDDIVRFVDNYGRMQ
jgi:mannose-1-phosphate guanylyltransferase/mannose-6-phosphate isomerase